MKLLSTTLLILSLSSLMSQVQSYAIPFSTTDNHEFLYASAASYCLNTSWLEDWNCGSVCNNLTGYHYYTAFTASVSLDEALQFIMIHNPTSKRFITAFQGTTKKTQLIQETLQSYPVNYTLHDVPEAQMYDYFGSYYVSTLRTPFLEGLKKAIEEYPDYLYVFTGHSLGGALTTLASQDAVLSGLLSASNTLVYTYGSPRVLNWHLAQNHHTLFGGIYRIVHHHDIVPHLPPCNLEDRHCDLSEPFNIGTTHWSPWHTGTEIWFNEDSTEYQTCTGNNGEDTNCSNSIPLLQCSVAQHTHYHGIEVGDTCNIDNLGPAKTVTEQIKEACEELLIKL